MLSGCTLGNAQAITTTANKFWSWHFHIGCFLEHYTGQQQLHLCEFDFIIKKAKHRVAFRFFQDNHHGNLCCIELCSLSTNMLTIFLPSRAARTEGCWAGLWVGVVAMVCMLIQNVGKTMSTLTKNTGCVPCATHYSMLKMNTTLFLVALCTVILEPDMQVFFN